MAFSHDPVAAAVNGSDGFSRPTWSTRREALRLFARGATLRVAGRVALVVGTILSVANQGSVILGGHPSWATWVRVAVNYLTQFVVASIGYLAGFRDHSPPAAGSDHHATGRTGARDRVPEPGHTSQPRTGSQTKDQHDGG